MKAARADLSDPQLWEVTISQDSTFTTLQANFTFVRHLSSHIFNSYIPSGLVVMLSFLSFWLNVRSVPARVALGLTSLLTLSTQASQVRSHLPPINYLTAIDVWLFSCILQVFLSLVEFATVYSLYSMKVGRLHLSFAKSSLATLLGREFE
ncbi:glutamate-gated chloride channel alpha [Trichonephila clavipes]|nr:glutamate-gated chloride channel alpha [Trichonephila clavipes]